MLKVFGSLVLVGFAGLMVAGCSGASIKSNESYTVPDPKTKAPAANAAQSRRSGDPSDPQSR